MTNTPAAVVDLKDRRLRRECVRVLEDMEAQMLRYRFETDPALVLQTSSMRLAELKLHYEALLAHLREPLLEAIETALVMGGEDADYVGAVGIVLGDLRHVSDLPKLLAARRAALPTEHARLDAMGAFRSRSPNTPEPEAAPKPRTLQLVSVPPEPDKEPIT